MSSYNLNNQAMSWWSRTTRNGFGETSYDLPQTVSGFWRDEQVEFIDSQQQQVFSQAVVVLGDCHEDIKEGDFIKSGTVDWELDDLTDPTNISGAHKIRRVTSTENRRRTDRVVFCYV